MNNRPKPPTAHVSLAEAMELGPPPRDNLAVPVFARNAIEVEFYMPKGYDAQQPHERDEVYVVARGTALFFDGDRRYPVFPGSFIFVEAGQLHRFEEFSDDFATWVLFF